MAERKPIAWLGTPVRLAIAATAFPLGENHLYLHGIPLSFAPDEQKSVPMWLRVGDFTDVDRESVELLRARRNSGDTLSHTLLTYFEVETESVHESEAGIRVRSEAAR